MTNEHNDTMSFGVVLANFYNLSSTNDSLLTLCAETLPTLCDPVECRQDYSPTNRHQFYRHAAHPGGYLTTLP